MGIPDHLTCLLKNMYVGQEQQLEPSMEKLILFKTEKRVQQSCLLSLCLFNLYAEHITRNARLDELQAGIKIDERNNNSLRYVDDTTLMAESEEELKSLLMRVKEESERAGLNLNIKKSKIMASGPIQFSSVQFSRSVMSDSLRPYESQHARPPCPSPTPGVHSDSCPSSP